MLQSTPLILALIAPVIFAVKYGVQLLKPYLELVVPNPTVSTAADYTQKKTLHDNTIRLFAVVLGAALLPAGGYFAGAWFHSALPLTPESLVTAAFFGAGAGLAALGDYHLLSALQAPPATPPPA